MLDIPEHFSPEAKKIIEDIRANPFSGSAPKGPPLASGAPAADCVRAHEEAMFILREHKAKQPKPVKPK